MNVMDCSKCGNEVRLAKDGLCGGCRVRLNSAQQIYVWTPEMDEQLRAIYRVARNRTDLSKALTLLIEKWKRPRYIIQNRAVRLNLRIHIQRRWTSEEIDLLHKLAGASSTRAIGKFLNRTPVSIQQKMFELQILAGVTEGFSQAQLARLMGANGARIAGWVSRGWLVMKDGRITQESVETFVWDHMDEFRFASCEDWWLKMIFRASVGVKKPVAIFTKRPKRSEAA